jgi:hypothetical protein
MLENLSRLLFKITHGVVIILLHMLLSTVNDELELLGNLGNAPHTRKLVATESSV